MEPIYFEDYVTEDSEPSGLSTDSSGGGFLDGLTLAGLLGAAGQIYSASQAPTAAAPARVALTPPAQVRPASQFSPWAIGAAVLALVAVVALVFNRK